MGARPISEWRDRHVGADVWVIASGASLRWVSPSFFDDRITVGVNEVYGRYHPSFLVRKEHVGAQQAIDSGIPLVIARGDCGDTQSSPLKAAGDWWEFEHPYNWCGEAEPDLTPIGTSDRLVVSWSTITTAVHFAAYVGARAIFVCGHDCGLIDGTIHYPDYGGVHAGGSDEFADEANYAGWLALIERQTMVVRDRLVEVYGCHIHGLNPFVSLALEGHTHSARPGDR